MNRSRSALAALVAALLTLALVGTACSTDRGELLAVESASASSAPEETATPALAGATPASSTPRGSSLPTSVPEAEEPALSVAGITTTVSDVENEAEAVAASEEPPAAGPTTTVTSAPSTMTSEVSTTTAAVSPTMVSETPEREAPSGAAYFIDSRSGDDANDGRSAQRPWRSIGRVADLWLEPGDQIYLARGSVWSDQLRLFGDGTQQQPIVATAYGKGLAPILENNGICIDVHASHVVLSEVHARDCWYTGVSITGSNVEVRHSLLERNRAGIDVVSGSSDNLITYNRLVDNNVMERSTPGGDDDSGAFAVLIAGDRTTVAWNVISGSDAFSHDYGRDGAAVEIYGGRNNVVHHNVSIRNNAFTELGHTRSADNLFAHNIVWSDLPESSGVTTRGGGTFGPVLGTRVLHNTFLLFGERNYAMACNPGCSPDVLDASANLVVTTDTSVAIGGTFGDRSNVYVGGEHYGDLSRSTVVDDITDEIWNLWFSGDLNRLEDFDVVPAIAMNAAPGSLDPLAFPQPFEDAGAVAPNHPWTTQLKTAGPTNIN